MPKIVDHDRRRHELSMVAASLVAERGIGALTVRGLARAAGVSTGVVSHYFQDSQDMLFAAHQLVYGSSGRRLLDDLAANTGLEGLMLALGNSLPTESAALAEWKVRIAFWGVSDFGEAVREFEEQASQSFTEVIARELSSRGYVGNAEALAEDLEAGLTGLAIQHLMSPGVHPAESIRSRFREQFNKGVGREF